MQRIPPPLQEEQHCIPAWLPQLLHHRPQLNRPGLVCSKCPQVLHPVAQQADIISFAQVLDVAHWHIIRQVAAVSVPTTPVTRGVIHIWVVLLVLPPLPLKLAVRHAQLPTLMVIVCGAACVEHDTPSRQNSVQAH
jgi:hypothetical protein